MNLLLWAECAVIDKYYMQLGLLENERSLVQFNEKIDLRMRRVHL